jgi:hypothetical protein
MRITEILLFLLVGWTAIGAVGVTASFFRQEIPKAWKNLGWIAAVWALYLMILLGVSLMQPQRQLAVDTPQCFGDLCFTVTGFDEIPGYLMNSGRLVRVKVDITNRGKNPANDSLLRSYLLDQYGRRWTEVPGLTGVSLHLRVPAGGTATSEPVFKLPADVTPYGLVLTHGRFQPGLLIIGDPDSLLHQPTIAKVQK